MNTELSLFQVRIACGVIAPAVLALLVAVPSTMHAQGNAKRKNPTSKVYVSDVAGSAQIETDDNVQDLNKRSVYNGEGIKIETGKTGAADSKGPVFSTMVYSNGTGAYFDQDTKVEVKKFVQEPFTPARSDMDTEPSISQTQAFVSRGVVGLCTSKLVAGSSMGYQTAQGSINIRGRKVVIQASDRETKISMLDGESTVRGGEADLGGQVLKAGQQAIIRSGGAGQPSQVIVQNIPPSEMAALDDKVAMACMARKSVYFEVKERSITNDAEPAAPEVAAEAPASVAATEDSSAKTGDAAPAAAPPAAGDAVASSSTTSSSTGAATSSSSGSASKPAATQVASTSTASGGASGSSSGAASVNAFDFSTASGAATGSASSFVPVSAFDAPPANANPAFQSTIIVQEIRVVQVVPQNLPVEFTTSDAKLRTATTPGG